jgi:membrane protease YdiL (CAAX protease family)
MPRPAWWPILLSSALFALMHWGQGLAPIPLFFFAVVLGYVYQRTHRLWPSLVAHALLNAGSLALLWFSVANLTK